jgi:hypothetical protein
MLSLTYVIVNITTGIKKEKMGARTKRFFLAPEWVFGRAP